MNESVPSGKGWKVLYTASGPEGEALTLCRYKPSLFALYPRPYTEKDFPLYMAAGRLRVRCIYGYRIYFLLDENRRLVGYETIMRNYPLLLRRYRFARRTDVFSDNYVVPECRGRGYAKLLTRAIAADPDTRWKGFWGLIKQSNIPSKREAAAVGFSQVGYVRERRFFIHKADAPADRQSFELWYMERK